MAKKKDKKGESEGGKAFPIPDEVKKAIFIVIFFALAFLLLLSLTGSGGTLGYYINKAMRLSFGWGAWLVPGVLIFSIYLAIGQFETRYKVLKLLAAVIFILCFCALLNLRLPLEAVKSYANRGQVGGYGGLVLSYPLLKLTGFLASLIILSSLGTIALLIIFETKLFNLGHALVWLGSRLRLGVIFSRFKHGVTERIKVDPEFIERIPTEPVKETEEKLPLKLKSEEKPIPASTLKAKVDFKQAEIESGEEHLTKSLRSKYRRKIDIPLNLLHKRSETPSIEDVVANKEKIKKTLEHFGVTVEMGGTSTGPTVTQYTLKPSEGVKLAQITALHNDLALALAAHPIRIEAPIPGKSLVGVEVPNSFITTVGLREIIQSQKFREERKSNLALALGKDVSGEPYIANLEAMPHLLIAGATGSGKSVSINSIIVSLLYQNSPDDLKFILIDPKRVELTIYNEIPHLLTPVITDAKRTINALKWAVDEMDRRYSLLADAGRRNLESYNKTADEILPYIVVMIDELADLMSVAAKEVEALIVRLAQMARAVGIHLVLATQRPSVNVITGLIKANITARIAFAVASQTDSRTILDSSGAEKLLGRGDMLFITAELSKPKRLQGAYVDDKEIKAVVRFLRDIAEPDYLEEITVRKGGSGSGGFSSHHIGGFDEEEGDDLLDEARDLIIRSKKASASYLQRHLRIGYARAARILDLLEAEGVIGPGDGAKPREVLLLKDANEERDEK